MTPLFSVARKELKAYFGSPMAPIFIGAFLLSVFFSFFWLETFFARNIADIRPLFRWMPLLLIFLVSALTMRQWSEEQRMGTMEVLLTLPVRIADLVLGKFLAVLALVAVALVLTGGLPLTVSFLGNLDWGPVAGGYLGGLLMASAYIAIGLFISSRTDNQIVALILSVLLSGLFYLVGSESITGFVGSSVGEFLRLLGTGSRFASIERGVIDLRDVVYYLSLTGFFLVLNVVSLDRKRWSSGSHTARYRRNVILATVLLAANLLAVNLWLHNAHALRADITEDHEYSISPVTRDLIASLSEPLVMRGYFSEKTHPLLAPLIPRIRDLMEEYKAASGGSIEVSFVDPKYDQEAESEANQLYGIKPVPFQVAGRYEASVVNSYFNILIKYGDQFVTLDYNDLIEVRQRKDGELDVGLRNLEYDLTKSIKKVVYGFQSVASIFAKSNKPMELVAVETPDSLPKPFAALPGLIRDVAKELGKESGGKLTFTEIDPDRTPGMDRETVQQQYGVKPLSLSFLGHGSFYLHLLLKEGNTIDRIYLRGDMGKADLRHEVEAALKRHAAGFMKTVAVWTPPAAASPMMMGQAPHSQYQTFRQVLSENYNLENADLSMGHVAGNVDVLLLVAPQNLNDVERFAVDQFLMRGGAVVALAGRYGLNISPAAQTLQVKEVTGGIENLLESYGIKVGKAMVMDSRNEPFPVPVTRNLGGFSVHEIQQIAYPFFVDVRSNAMDSRSPMVANLPAVTMNWVSPLTVDKDKNSGRKVMTLLRSSPDSWLQTSTDIQPDFRQYPEYGFPVGDKHAARPLAVSVQGSFSSFFAGKPDPRLVAREKQEEAHSLAKADHATKKPVTADQELPPPLLSHSPDSARLVVVGSSDFINDTVIGITRSIGRDRYLNSLEFLQNAVDWSVEDDDLLTIRSRGQHARLLLPLDHGQQLAWEWFNYGLALFALLVLSFVAGRRRQREVPLTLDPVGQEESGSTELSEEGARI